MGCPLHKANNTPTCTAVLASDGMLASHLRVASQLNALALRTVRGLVQNSLPFVQYLIWRLGYPLARMHLHPLTRGADGGHLVTKRLVG